MARNKMGIIGKKSLFLVMGLMGLVGTGQSSFLPANNSVSVRHNDAINAMPTAPRPVSIKKNFHGGDNPYKYYKKGIYNQRQYRKKLRVNPHFRNSKKCKL